jgi:hypothetical protein
MPAPFYADAPSRNLRSGSRQATAWSPAAACGPACGPPGPARYSGQPHAHAPSSPPRWSQRAHPHLQAGSALSPVSKGNSSTTPMSRPPSGGNAEESAEACGPRASRGGIDADPGTPGSGSACPPGVYGHTHSTAHPLQPGQQEMKSTRSRGLRTPTYLSPSACRDGAACAAAPAVMTLCWGAGMGTAVPLTLCPQAAWTGA